MIDLGAYLTCLAFKQPLMGGGEHFPFPPGIKVKTHLQTRRGPNPSPGPSRGPRRYHVICDSGLCFITIIFYYYNFFISLSLL